MREFADDKLAVAQTTEFVLDTFKNIIVRKGKSSGC